MLISTEAIVLKTIPYGDSSIISRVFTEQNGKVSVIAKGAWRAKNITGLIMEPMSHIFLQYYHKNNRQIQTVKDANLIQQFFNIRSNLNKIILGQAIVEIIDKSTHEQNSLPILYRLGWKILEKMNQLNSQYLVIFAFFLYQLSLRLGFMPNINTCCQCNSQLINALINEKYGELCCKNCHPNGNLFLTKNSLIFLQELAILHLDEIQKQKFDSLEIINVLNFLDIFTFIHIDGMKNVRSLKMVRKLIK